MKIKSFKDARAIADLMVAGDFQKRYCIGYDADKPFVQLWDNEVSNRLMIVIREDIWGYTVAFTDTVNDTEFFEELTISEIEEAIWHHRKFINQSGQLDSIEIWSAK